MATDIDDSLYSRQRYVLGDGAMHKLAKANVLIVGLGGVGIEVAKNVILAGVKSVTLLDNTICTVEDLGTQFFLRQEDIDAKISRARGCCKRLAELNPYVSITTVTDDVINHQHVLSKYQCIVATELTFDDQIKIDSFCRNHSPPIPFISCDVFGVFSYLFCDFGDKFMVHDSDGEEYKETFVGSISKSNPCIVKTLDYRRHGLQTGDVITFNEIKGMDTLNGTSHKIKNINPSSFSIDVDTTASPEYQYGGVFKKIKELITVSYQSLEHQLLSPDLLINDLSKLDAPKMSFIGLSALNMNSESWKTLSKNIVKFPEACKKVNEKLSCKAGGLDEGFLKSIAKTCCGKLAPLCAAVGGIAAQEVLKGLSGKFMPLKQWLMIDAVELCEGVEIFDDIGHDRYSSLLNCIDSKSMEILKNTKLFMIGCGAIGCEMLKNYALLGVGAGEGGLITITDNDLIEKSNLNRQFLFRPWHIQKSKAVTAAGAAKEINPALVIDAHQNKVSSQTQDNIYNDAFFTSQHIIVNALDNVEARRYVDSRCVANQKALIETGTMGPKGHVQVVVPFITESYSDQRDPADEHVPYCTLKSFPQVIEHTIQWARDKFERLFNLKPTTYNKFWETQGSLDALKEKLDSSPPDGFVDSVGLLIKKPCDWSSCVSMARIKFELYYKHKALQLLHAFPLDTVQEDGTLFWQSPKRPPKPIEFSVNNDEHLMFITSFARLTANIHGIKVHDNDLTKKVITEIINVTDVPKFVPSNKKIEIDDSKKAENVSTNVDNYDKITKLTNFIKSSSNLTVKPLEVEHFEKDDDSNGHIDFITSASNLRATMYNIPNADRYKTKRIAGRIIPAIATTTAAIAGLASLELIKVLVKTPLEKLKNCFLNLALPMMILSEPGPPPKTTIKDCLQFSMWDRWIVKGNKGFRLQDLINHFLKTHNLKISMVCEGVKMVYMPVMPGHMKRPKELMTKLLNPKPGVEYTDLIIGFEPDSYEDDDLPAPPVRYFYQ